MKIKTIFIGRRPARVTPRNQGGGHAKRLSCQGLIGAGREVSQILKFGGLGTAGDVFLQWLTDLHQAGVFGAPYRLLLCITGLGIATLCVTGVVVWLRKRRGRQRVLSQ